MEAEMVQEKVKGFPAFPQTGHILPNGNILIAMNPLPRHKGEDAGAIVLEKNPTNQEWVTHWMNRMDGTTVNGHYFINENFSDAVYDYLKRE